MLISYNSACLFNKDLRVVIDVKFPSQKNNVRKNKIIFFLTFFKSMISVLGRLNVCFCERWVYIATLYYMLEVLGWYLFSYYNIIVVYIMFFPKYSISLYGFVPWRTPTLNNFHINNLIYHVLLGTIQKLCFLGWLGRGVHPKMTKIWCQYSNLDRINWARLISA